MGDQQAVYGQLIDALCRERRFDEAFAYAERAKARALVEMLASREQRNDTRTACRLRAARVPPCWPTCARPGRNSSPVAGRHLPRRTTPATANHPGSEGPCRCRSPSSPRWSP
jgi:pentatricopeptide repeat protein